MSTLLSMEGGGTWGLIHARTLAKLHPGENGLQILSHYDLVAATSAGAIILAGLMADMSPDAIASLFLDEGTRGTLFVRNGNPIDMLAAKAGIGPKWSTAAKFTGLQAILTETGANPLSSAPTRVAIVAFDVDRQRDVILASYNEHADVPLVLAAHASSNPPVIYFDNPVTIKGMRLWDGGVCGLSNPAMLAVCEAFALGMSDVRILSLGTGTVERPVGPIPVFDKQPARLGIFGSVSIMAQSIMDDPPSFSTWAACAATGGKCVRLSPVLAPDADGMLPTIYLTMGGSEAFEALAEADMDVQVQGVIELLDHWCQEWLANHVPNQLIRTSEVEGKIYGQTTAAAAIAEWKRLAE